MRDIIFHTFSLITSNTQSFTQSLSLYLSFFYLFLSHYFTCTHNNSVTALEKNPLSFTHTLSHSNIKKFKHSHTHTPSHTLTGSQSLGIQRHTFAVLKTNSLLPQVQKPALISAVIG